MELTSEYKLLVEQYLGNTGYGNVYIRTYAKCTIQQIEQNRSAVTVKSVLYLSAGTFTTGHPTKASTWASGMDGVGDKDVHGTYSSGETILTEIGGWITHNADGTYSNGYATTDFTSTPWGWNGTAYGTFSLKKIPRYATCNQSLNSKTETTIKMNWSSDNTIDYLWYSKNNGSSWTAVGSVNATSGSYSITGLTPNTTYNIKTRVRRKDSQLTTDSSSLSITTYKAPTHSLKSKTETSIVMNWSADSTIDYIWYSKDNGTNWTGVDVTDGTSGTYTISGLSANTSYNVKTRLRRKATQTTYDCSAISITTYNYPHVTTVTTSNLIIGNSQKLTLYNPLSRTVTVKMNKDSTSGTQLYSGTTNSTSITFTPTASTLYASIPSSKSAKCVYSVVYSTSTKTTNQYTYSINEANCIPIFNNFTYADVDTTITSLTGNNQLLVNNNSNCQFTISTTDKATAKNSASIVKYKCEWGSKSTEVNYSSTANVTARVDDSTGNTLKVTAIDSRGLSASVTKTITNIAYVNAVVNEVTPERKNGIDVETYLKLKLTLWNGNWKNGSDTAYNNQLKYVGYRVYDGSSWTSYFDITSTVKTNMSSYTSGNSLMINVPISKKMTIHANGTSGGFEIGKEYKIQVLIKDGTSTATFTPTSYQATLQGTVTDGKVGFSRYKDSDGNYHYGINGMPNSSYNFNINGNQALSGHLYLDGVTTDSSNNKAMIIFGNHTNQYAFIKVNTYGSFLISPSKTDNSKAINFEHQNLVFKSNSDGKIALGSSTYRWNGVYSSGDMYVTKGSGDTYFRAKRSDTGVEALFGVGGGGTNHGIYSMKMGKWLVYSDGTNGYLNGNATNVTQKKSLSSKSHSNFGTNNGYVPDMSFIAYWNGAYSSSNASNLTYAHQGIIQCKPISLYDNSTGTKGTVTLSQTAANFTYLEIFYKISQSETSYKSATIYSPNGKYVNLEAVLRASNQTVNYIFSTIYSISGTTMTVKWSGRSYFYNDSTNSIATDNGINIVKVVGWK